MSLQSCHLVPLEDEAADAAVELAGEQQFDHGGFDVLLLVLVDVERVLQLLRDVVCKSPENRACGSTQHQEWVGNGSGICILFGMIVLDHRLKWLQSDE